MYCGECGAKLEKDATFCSECGAKVEPLAKKETSKKEVAVKQSTPRSPKKPMSKAKKITLAICAVIIIALFLGYNHLSEKFGPKGVAKEYVEAVMNKDSNALYGYLNIEGDKTFVSKEKFKKVMEGSNSTQEITNYRIDEVTYGDGKLSARVKISYTVKDAQSEGTEIVYLTKGKKKKYMIFDTWELKEDFGSVLVKDYDIKVPKGSKVTIEKTELGEKYLNKKDSSKGWDVYTIPQIFKAEVTIKTIIAGFEVTDKVTPSSLNYTASLDLDSLSSENVEKLENQVKTDITTLYQNLIEKKNWDVVKDSYNFKGADLDDLEEEYQDLYESVAENSSRTLKTFEISSVKISTLSSEEDGLIRVGVRFNYNYTVDYKRYDDSIEEKNGKNNSNSTLYYRYSDGALKLVDASYLVSYFSVY